MSPDHKLELFKAALTLGVSSVTVAFGWLVGQRLTLRWNLRQKQRELDLSTAHDFHELYGEFFAIWKLWNYSLTPEDGCTMSRSELLVRACAAEGAVESLFVRLAAGRDLSPSDIITLGRFRQGYQTMRETIRDNIRLAWDHPSHPEYFAFKQLATAVALLVTSETSAPAPVTKRRAQTLISITSERGESNRTWAAPD